MTVERMFNVHGRKIASGRAQPTCLSPSTRKQKAEDKQFLTARIWKAKMGKGTSVRN